MEAGQGDELELVAHGSELALELRDGGIVEVLAPVERRRAVVGQHLVRVLGVDRLGELLGCFEVRCGGLHPQHVRVGSERQSACDACFDAVANLVEAFGGALTGDELLVALVDVRGHQRGCLGVGTGDDEAGHVLDVGREAGGVERADVLRGRDEDLAAEVAALLLGTELILEVHTGSAGCDHRPHEFVDVDRAAEARFRVGDDRSEPVVDLLVAFRGLDLVGAHQSVVDAADDLRHRVGRIDRLVGVGLTGGVRVGGDLPAGEVDGVEAGLDLLDCLVAGQCTECVDVVTGVDVAGGDLVPEALGSVTGQRVLLDQRTAQFDDILGLVVTSDSRPAGVGGPVAANGFSIVQAVLRGVLSHCPSLSRSLGVVDVSSLRGPQALSHCFFG